MLVTFHMIWPNTKDQKYYFRIKQRTKKGYLASSPKHFDFGISVQKANRPKCLTYLRFRLRCALQSIQRADLGLAPIYWGHTISQEKYLTCLYSGLSGNILDKLRTKLHWMQADVSLMATAFSLISSQSFLLWRDKGKDYDQDEVILRQLRSACSKTTRQLMGISTFYLDRTTLSIYKESFFLMSSCFLFWVFGSVKEAPFCTFTLFFLRRFYLTR